MAWIYLVLGCTLLLCAVDSLGIDTSCATPGRFGYRCLYECHCSEPCDGDTGLCPGDCDRGWSGPSCQIRNLALDRPTNDSGVYANFRSRLAVDGDRRQGLLEGSCFHSNDCCPKPDRAYLIVDLGLSYSTDLMRIYYRRYFLLGFFRSSVYVSDSVVDSGQPCYTFVGGNDAPFILNFRCQGRGRYVIVYNPGFNPPALLEICELEVYGCSAGTYGQFCNETCFCRDAPCDHVTGLCSGACLPGWTGSTCSEVCPNGTFGAGCSGKCFCENETLCDSVSGLCPGGCQPGYVGSACNETCLARRFGPSCNSSCHCAAGTCNHVTGLCPGSCQPGWHGNTCSQRCEPGRYGKDCMETCGQCRGFDPCHHVDGRCPAGCLQGWSDPWCKSSRTSAHGSGGSQSLTLPGQWAGLTVGIVAIVVIVVVGMVVVFLLKRRREGDEGVADDENVKMALNTIPPEVSRKSTRVKRVRIREASSVDYYNVEVGPTKSVLSVSELQDYAETNRRNGKLDREFEAIPTGLTGMWGAAKRRTNKGKNRFQGCFPYDFNRVVLNGQSGNDYINASYINGYREPTAYIAAQAPNKKTLVDFWRMIWQEKVDRIVMLTNLMEFSKVKCERYWPETGKVMYDDISVAHTDTVVRAAYTVRTFTVTHKQERGERTVRQLHFTAWPDHDVPEDIMLVGFQRVVSSTPTVFNGPMLVHCSAGIGRTGTYIGLEGLVRQAQEEGSVDVSNFVTTMRQQRRNMVQTKDQYTFLYEAVVETLKHGNKVISHKEFKDTFHPEQSELYFGELSVSSMYQELVDEMNKIRELDQEILDDFGSMENVYENKDELEFSPVELESQISMQGFFITSLGNAETAEGAWRLVFDMEASALITLEGTPEILADHIPTESDTATFRRFHIARKSEQELSPGVHKRTLCVRRADDSKERTVEHFSMVAHPLDPGNHGDQLTSLLEALSLLPPPLVVLVRCGLHSAALWCALKNAADGLRLDGQVDLFQSLRLVQRAVPSLQPSKEEFVKCLEFLLKYGDQERSQVHS